MFRSPVIRAAVLVCVLLLSPRPGLAQDTAGFGDITGIVRDAGGAPAPAVTICAVGTDRCELSDADGVFRLRGLRADGYQIRITPPDIPPFDSELIDVRAGLDAHVEVTLPQPAAVQQTVTVTAPAFSVPEEIKSSGFLIASGEVRAGAGALEDVSRFVQALPGVVPGTDDFRNDIIVRGGSPLENLFVVDNVEIPNINTFANFSSAGGSVSILDAALLQNVTFLTGGYPAPFGNRVSSVLQVTQREGDRRKTSGRLTLGFAGAGAIVEGPIGRSAKGSWVVSARRSFLDIFTKDLGFGGVPVTYTVNSKAVYDVSPVDRVWLVSITGVDRIRLGLADGFDPEDEVNEFDIRYRGWRSATGLNWQRVFGTRVVGLFGASYATAHVTSTVKDLVRNGVPPAGVPADQVIAAGPVVFREGSREAEASLKYDATIQGGPVGRIQLGGATRRVALDYDLASPFGADSPFSATPGINPFSLTRPETTWQSAVYAQTTRALGTRLNLTVGARIDDYRFLRQTRVGPRAGLTVRLSDRLSWHASGGTYYQQPLYLFAAAFPENRALVPVRATHAVTGLTYLASGGVRLGAEVYEKRYSDYPVARQFPALSLANLGDTFDVRSTLFPLLSAGRGTARGIEFSAERQQTGTWYGQANLSFARAEHAGLDGVLRPGAFDYPVVANATGGWVFRPRWQATARVTALGGRPFTPFDAALSTAQRRGIYDLSAVNTGRAPAYFRLDLRAEHTLGRTRPLILFAGVQNVTNRKNFASYTWNRRLNRQTFSEQMGAFPLIGLEWRF